MATTTTNFGWDIPQSTDLVKDGATAIAALGQDIDTALVDLKGGTTGQVLAKASGTDLDYSWTTPQVGDITAVTAGTGISGGGTGGDVTITNSMATAIDAKGDLIAGTGADAFSRLAIGTNNQVLTADSAAATGMKWAAPVSTAGMTLIQTTSFSAVSSQSINSVFSSTYDNYRIIFSATSAANLTLNWRLRVSGTDDSGNNYTVQNLFATGSGVSAIRDSSISNWNWLGVRTTLLSPMAIDIFNPAKASPTIAYANAQDISDPSLRINLGIHNQNTAYDGFNMICSASNMTGAVSIYGYNK